MNQYTFDLIAQHRPEVLERVLRVIRLRGFTVTNMDMALVETKVQLKITVKSDRTFDLLVNQLAKLPDVLNIIKKEFEGQYDTKQMVYKCVDIANGAI